MFVEFAHYDFGGGMLQWGRDVLVADVTFGFVFVRIHVKASMGPRRFSRGCLVRLRLSTV
jgi:hypothetical protein